jgi:uncharacterized protein
MEKKLSLERHIRLALSNRYLELILLPTEKCNFRCQYCYEVQRKDKMPSYVVDGIKRLITLRAPSLATMNIVWFGGEPLLTKPIIDEIMLHALQAKKERPSLNLISTIYTNGYLLDNKTSENLAQLGIGWFHMTLDGWGEQHDSTRKRADGGKTFDRIWNNLLMLHRSSLKVQFRLRVHYSLKNWENLKLLLDRVNDEFGEDERFALYFRPISRWGSPNDYLIEKCPLEKHEQISHSLKKMIRSHKMVANVPDVPLVCYATQANSFVIRSNGDILKCIIPMDAPVNLVGRIREDGSFYIDSKKLNLWVSALGAKGTGMARACPYTHSVEVRKFRGI